MTCRPVWMGITIVNINDRDGVTYATEEWRLRKNPARPVTLIIFSRSSATLFCYYFHHISAFYILQPHCCYHTRPLLVTVQSDPPPAGPLLCTIPHLPPCHCLWRWGNWPFLWLINTLLGREYVCPSTALCSDGLGACGEGQGESLVGQPQFGSWGGGVRCGLRELRCKYQIYGHDGWLLNNFSFYLIQEWKNNV